MFIKIEILQLRLQALINAIARRVNSAHAGGLREAFLLLRVCKIRRQAALQGLVPYLTTQEHEDVVLARVTRSSCWPCFLKDRDALVHLVEDAS
jgi:hypothetical protein